MKDTATKIAVRNKIKRRGKDGKKTVKERKVKKKEQTKVETKKREEHCLSKKLAKNVNIRLSITDE